MYVSIYLSIYLSVSVSSLRVSIVYLSIATHLRTYPSTYYLPTTDHLCCTTGQRGSFSKFPNLARKIFTRATSTYWLVARPLPTQYCITKMMPISMPRMGSEPSIPLFQQQKLTPALDRGVTAVDLYHCTGLHLHFVPNWWRPYKLQDPNIYSDIISNRQRLSQSV